jgi:hypothetical protein
MSMLVSIVYFGRNQISDLDTEIEISENRNIEISMKYEWNSSEFRFRRK